MLIRAVIITCLFVIFFIKNLVVTATDAPLTPPIPQTPTINPNTPPFTPSVPSEPVISPQALKKNRIFQSSQYLTYNDKTKTYHIWSNVRIQYKDSILTADDATFNEVTQVGVVTGNPKLTQPGVTITGDKMHVFYIEHKAVIEGNVHGIYDKKQVPPKQNNVSKPQNNNKKDDGPVHMYAPHAEFYWEKNQGKATGGVKVEQKDKTITSETATFDNAANKIVFLDNVVVHRGKDDSMTSQKLTLNTVLNEAIAEGNVEAIVMVEESEHKSKSKNSSSETKIQEKPKSRRQLKEETEKRKKEVEEKLKEGKPKEIKLKEDKPKEIPKEESTSKEQS